MALLSRKLDKYKQPKSPHRVSLLIIHQGVEQPRVRWALNMTKTL